MQFPVIEKSPFGSVGRPLSFTKVVAELNVTPAAVSHQVKALEALLEVCLFRRLTRALRLTEAGQGALPTISEGFDKLAQGVEQMRIRHPKIEIRIDGTDRLVDLEQNPN